MRGLNVTRDVKLEYTMNYIFFFFKQKTAYEVSISDWSSDVCSSDLPCRRRELADAAANSRRRQGRPQGIANDHRLTMRLGKFLAVMAADPTAVNQIGRASCR